MDDEVRVKQRKDDTSMTSVNCTRRFDEVDDRGNKKMLIAVNCQTVPRSTLRTIRHTPKFSHPHS